jgi:hypothetical protein
MPKEQTPAPSPAPAAEPQPTVGQIVHLHGTKWSGPRPGIIVHVDSKQYIDANIFLHGDEDQPLLTTARLSPSGTTIERVPIFAGPADDQYLIDECGGWRQVYAVWPPKV